VGVPVGYEADETGAVTSRVPRARETAEPPLFAPRCRTGSSPWWTPTRGYPREVRRRPRPACAGPAAYEAAIAVFGREAVPRLSRLGHIRHLAQTGRIVVSEVHCTDDRRQLAGPAIEATWCLVMVRRGGFLRRADGHEDFFDAASAYLARPGQEILVGHPAGPGDVSTMIGLPEELVDRAFAGAPPLPSGKVVTSAEFDVHHRLLVAASRLSIDPLELGDRVHGLLAMLPARERRTRVPPRAAVAHRRLVAAACEAIAERGFALSLDELAGQLNCSPHHLSRVFHRVTGHTLTFYRNQLRVRAVLEDVQQGATNLRFLAGEYGFADQAHMARVVGRHLGRTPRDMARMLRPVEH
jgi:AraC-like DNA-binding protein